MNTHVVAPAAGEAKRLHQRRLKAAVEVVCRAFEMNGATLRGVFGPLNLMLWEAKVLGLDDAALDALIDSRTALMNSRGQYRSGYIANHMPLPLAA